MKKGIFELLKVKAIIIMASFVFISCEKSTGSLGLDLVLEDKVIIGTKRNIPIKSHTAQFDSVLSTNPQRVIAGHINDEFGASDYQFVSQFLLEGPSPDFGERPVVDSVKLFLPYDGHYGDTNVLTTMQVFELDDDISADSNFYSNVKFNVSDLVAEKKDFYPEPNSNRLFNDGSSVPTLEMEVDTAWASLRIIQASKTSPENFESNDAFVKYMHGLHFSTGGTGNAALYYDLANFNSVVRIYYRVHPDSTAGLSFDLESGGATAVNTVEYDYSSAAFDLNNQDTTNGEIETYLQTMGGVTTVLNFDALKTYKDSSFLINKAEIVFRMRPGSGADLAPPDRLLLLEAKSTQNVFVKDFLNNPLFGGIKETDALRETKYTFNITRLIHDYLNTEDVVNDLIVIPTSNSASANRLVLGGNQNMFIPFEFNIYFTRTK
jgi:hypothetical protein